MEAKNSVFVETFGESPYLKVLDFFLTYDAFDYSKSQVADETGVSRITLDKIWHDLEKKKIIVRSRRIGRAELYKLNKSNPRVKMLLSFSLKIASAFAEEEINKANKKIEV